MVADRIQNATACHLGRAWR